jgi:hypothetical protein
MRDIKAHELDLALISDGSQPLNWPGVVLWRGKLVWVTSSRNSPHRVDPLPVALANPERFLMGQRDCEWTSAAMTALEKAGRRYRVAYTSASQLGTHAPVIAGLAVTVSTLSWLPDGLRPLGPDEGLPPLPDFGILMLKPQTKTQAVTEALAAHIEANFQAIAARSGSVRRVGGVAAVSGMVG